jgi:hypothetical protein
MKNLAPKIRKGFRGLFFAFAKLGAGRSNDGLEQDAPATRKKWRLLHSNPITHHKSPVTIPLRAPPRFNLFISAFQLFSFSALPPPPSFLLLTPAPASTGFVLSQDTGL